jgi:catechol 2,3-dioxygenase-like lactoylglutathione lyase family enzyme
MPIHKIHHITINATDLDKTCAFYGDVLGFRVEKREGRGMTGAWLFLGDHPFVHLAARRPEQTPDTIGIVDHFALEATDIADMRQRLNRGSVPFRENPVPELAFHQLIVHDPNGIKVELYFRGQDIPS